MKTNLEFKCENLIRVLEWGRWKLVTLNAVPRLNRAYSLTNAWVILGVRLSRPKLGFDIDTKCWKYFSQQDVTFALPFHILLFSTANDAQNIIFNSLCAVMLDLFLQMTV